MLATSLFDCLFNEQLTHVPSLFIHKHSVSSESIERLPLAANQSSEAAAAAATPPPATPLHCTQLHFDSQRCHRSGCVAARYGAFARRCRLEAARSAAVLFDSKQCNAMQLNSIQLAEATRAAAQSTLDSPSALSSAPY